MARTQTTTAARRAEYTPGEEEILERRLYLALELSKSSWLLGFRAGLGQKLRRCGIAAWDLAELEREIARAKKRFGLAEDAEVMSCYEVGREGFSVHRALESLGVDNVPVASSSIEVKRGKGAKTDRLDLDKLSRMLVRYGLGEVNVWSVVRVPSVDAEDFRHLHRERATLKKLRTAESNRLRSLLAIQGIAWEGRIDGSFAVEELRCWDGSALPRFLRYQLDLGLERLHQLDQQLDELETLRRSMLADPASYGPHQESLELIQLLMQLTSLGINSAWVLVAEFFGWREFRNRKQVGGASGLCGTPYNSGTSQREQGISHAGNAWIRPVMIELAWLWRRWQPQSRLTLWFEQEWGKRSSRHRKVGIVALARKLLIALWRYLEHGEVPDGARLKAA
ncbi:MAG: IS110 family transposase [Thermoanaerobaculia bacterium]